MTKQHIYLPKYDWIIACYYNVKEKDIPDEIPSTGLFSRLNTGLTYTNPDKRKTWMFIGKTSSASQFLNSLDHEKLHVTTHIADYYNITPQEEEFEYLAGDIALRIFPKVKQYICRC